MILFLSFSCHAGKSLPDVISIWQQQPILADYREARRRKTHAPSRRCCSLLAITFCALVATFPVPSGAVVNFDLEKCSHEAPCCINADEVAILLGPFTKSFCKIEYPVRFQLTFCLAKKEIPPTCNSVRWACPWDARNVCRFQSCYLLPPDANKFRDCAAACP